jgi:shikimate kinase
VTNQIIIVGFMGTGKTTLARELAQRLGCAAVDLDDLIMNNERRSPKEIIEQNGENRFREIETRMLREALLEGAARIVAVGGGAWTMAQNRKLIADNGAFTVWLDAPFELCWKRIEAGGKTRPLAHSRELAQELYRERQGIYELADARITVAESDNVEEIASRIIRELRERTRAPMSDIS